MMQNAHEVELHDVVDVKFPDEDEPRRGYVSDIKKQKSGTLSVVVWDDDTEHDPSMMLMIKFADRIIYRSSADEDLFVKKVLPEEDGRPANSYF